MWAPPDFCRWYIWLACLDTPLSQNELSGLRFLETLRRIRGNAQFFSNLLCNLIKPPNHFFFATALCTILSSSWNDNPQSYPAPGPPSRNKAITHVAVTLPICQGVNIDSRKVIHACVAHHFYLRKKWNPIPSDSPGERNNMSCLPPFHFPRISCTNLPERLECQRVMQLKRSVKPIASRIVLFPSTNVLWTPFRQVCWKPRIIGFKVEPKLVTVLGFWGISCFHRILLLLPP